METSGIRAQNRFLGLWSPHHIGIRQIMASLGIWGPPKVIISDNWNFILWNKLTRRVIENVVQNQIVSKFFALTEVREIWNHIVIFFFFFYFFNYSFWLVEDWKIHRKCRSPNFLKFLWISYWKSRFAHLLKKLSAVSLKPSMLFPLWAIGENCQQSAGCFSSACSTNNPLQWSQPRTGLKAGQWWLCKCRRWNRCSARTHHPHWLGSKRFLSCQKLWSFAKL